MAATGTPTPNIGLRIPIGTDPASVDDINYNSNLLDTKLGAVGSDSVQDQIDTLNGKLAFYQSQITSFESSWSATNAYVMYNSIVAIVRVNGLRKSSTANGWVSAFQLPSAMRNLPIDNQYGCFANDSGMSGGVTNVVQVRVTQQGYVQIYAPQANMATWGSIVFFL